jgi:hypothetical protein
MNLIQKAPIWLFELMTTAKSFKDNPIIGSPFLNRLGLHVLRLLVSHGVMKARMFILGFSVASQDRQAYFQKGFIIKENFLSEEDFQALEKEARSFSGEVREARQGDTLTQRAVLSPDVLQAYPAMDKLLANHYLAKLAHFSAGHLRAPLFYLENVKNKYCEGVTDPQKTLHADTFHPTMKCWFFIDDVAQEAGPFNYVPGSNKLTWKRLKWEYQMSLKAKYAENSYHAKGSIRFTADDLTQLGLPEPQAFAVKKNTLVIANTFGIHRRGDSLEKSTRLAIWGDSRTNPFLPFPGLGGKFINGLQYYFLDLYRKDVDKKAAKRGVPAPWRVIEESICHHKKM